MRKQNIALLVGPVCTGKTTWIKNMRFDYVVSSDDIVDSICEKYGISYTEFFRLDFNHKIRKEQRKKFHMSVEKSKKYRKVAWDLTNLTRKERERAMSNYKDAKFLGFEFEHSDHKDKIFKLNQHRKIKTGKFIPEEVIKSMFNKYQPISEHENFDLVMKVDMLNALNENSVLR